jgi:hypothetical protein
MSGPQMRSAADTEGTGLEPEPLLGGHSPSCEPTFRTRFYREPVRCTCQRAEIEARGDGCDRLAQFGVIWWMRARETAWPAARHRAGRWRAARDRRGASRQRSPLAGRIVSYRARTDPVRAVDKFSRTESRRFAGTRICAPHASTRGFCCARSLSPIPTR